MDNVFHEKILITGGLGFIGSNLAIRLVQLGAVVTLVDNMISRQGGNLFNISPIADKVHVNFSDVRNQLSMDHLVQGKDYIFHLPVDENHPTNPKGIYVVTNLTAEKIILVYHDIHKIQGVCLWMMKPYRSLEMEGF